MAQQPPTESLLLHLFRHLEGFKVNGNNKLNVKRLAQLGSYIFTREYPGCESILIKKKIEMKLFAEGEERFTTFEDVVPFLFSPETLSKEKEVLASKDGEKIRSGLLKIPGGKQLLEKIDNAWLFWIKLRIINYPVPSTEAHL